MGLLLNLSLLVACLCVLQVYGYNEESEYRRALRAFHLLQRDMRETQLADNRLRVMDDCVARNQTCRSLPKCCGNDHCYWENGFVPFTDGVCVQCVKEGKKCQKNAQCCYGLQCDKDEFWWVNGECKPPRTTGDCYQDTQCEHECKWGWIPLNGDCV